MSGQKSADVADVWRCAVEMEFVSECRKSCPSPHLIYGMRRRPAPLNLAQLRGNQCLRVESQGHRLGLEIGSLTTVPSSRPPHYGGYSNFFGGSAMVSRYWHWCSLKGGGVPEVICQCGHSRTTFVIARLAMTIFRHWRCTVDFTLYHHLYRPPWTPPHTIHGLLSGL